MGFKLPPFELFDVPETLRSILADPSFQDAAEQHLRSEVETSLNVGGRDIHGNTGVFPPSNRVLQTGGKTLYDTGRMMESLTVDTVLDGDVLKWSIGFTARSNSGYPYADAHMYGATVTKSSQLGKGSLAGTPKKKQKLTYQIPVRNLGFQNAKSGDQGLPMESISRAIKAGFEALV